MPRSLRASGTTLGDKSRSTCAVECSLMKSVIAGSETTKSPIRQQLTMSTVCGDGTELGFNVWIRRSAGNSRITEAYFGRKRSFQGAANCLSLTFFFPLGAIEQECDVEHVRR